MTKSILQNKLHHFIDNADVKKLKKMFSFVEDELEESLDLMWNDDDFVKELEKRSDEIKTGKVRGVSWDEIKRGASLENDRK